MSVRKPEEQKIEEVKDTKNKTARGSLEGDDEQPKQQSKRDSKKTSTSVS